MIKPIGDIPFYDQDIQGWNHLTGDERSEGPEKNTPIETAIARVISNWVKKPTPGLANKIYQNWKFLKKLEKQFPKIFAPPLGELVYRGIRISDTNRLKQVFSKPGMLVTRRGRLYLNEQWFGRTSLDGGTVYKAKFPFKYNSIKSVSSWTTQPKIAFSFSNAGYSGIGIVLKARVDEDFLFNPLFMNNVFARVLGGEVS